MKSPSISIDLADPSNLLHLLENEALRVALVTQKGIDDPVLVLYRQIAPLGLQAQFQFNQNRWAEVERRMLAVGRSLLSASEQEWLQHRLFPLLSPGEDGLPRGVDLG